MIDTTILRIHGLDKYANLIKNYELENQLKNKESGITRESIETTSSELRKLRRLGYKSGKQIIEAVKINRSGEYLIRTKSGKHRNASNHYDVSYYIEPIKDYIEFNFSIPKYNYGSNVLMFVDHFGDKEYNFHTCCEADHNINRSFDLLQYFLKNFFRMEFVGSKVDYNDVEVHRIDVCFNQLFQSKQEALKYLEYQKRKPKKYSRDEEGSVYEYKTSWMYKSIRYSAKIYHKGSEYEKNDLKEHERYNKEKKRQYFKPAQYQAFADRILRYELTIRNKMLNDLHKSTLFRQKCPFYQKHYAIYRAVENSDQRNDRIAKKIGTLSPELHDAYLLEHPYEKVPSDLRRTYKHVQKLINRRTYFKLAIDETAKTYNKYTTDYQSDDALFSRDLLLLCLYKLVDFIHEFQIEELPPESKIENLIDEYNLRHRKKLPKREMCSIYGALKKVGSFKDLIKFNHLSRASMYRYKARFKKIGITENNLIPLTENGIPRADLDFRSYHWELTTNPHFLDKRNFIGLL